jgi:glycosyltransferase involved in cell wall biosynthesis
MGTQIDNLDILWLGYDGVHPAHKDFAESIGADVVDLTIDSDPGYSNAWRYIRNGIRQGHYDYVICNEGPSLRSGVPMKLYSWLRPRKSNTKVIRYLANANYYFITQGTGARPYFNKFIANFVDGAMANSDFTKENGSKFISGPIKKALPPIKQSLYDELPQKSPDLGSRKILSVGGDNRYKGKDLLIDAFEIVREEYPEAKLDIVGGGSENLRSPEGVETHGYVEDIASFYDSRDLHVQSSRADGFAVVALEAMRAGVPPLVTETTGASEVVEGLDDELICKPTPESIAEGIKNYFEFSSSKKRELSRQGREISDGFSPSEKKAGFRDAFQQLVDEIEK